MSTPFTQQLEREARNNALLLRLLIANAYTVYYVSHRPGFFDNFKEGDLVMETSTVHKPEMDKQRIGYFVSYEMEDVFTDEAWETEKAFFDKRPQNRVHVIKRLVDGELQRWTDAHFVKVVTNPRMAHL